MPFLPLQLCQSTEGSQNVKAMFCAINSLLLQAPVVELLLLSGIDPNVRNEAGETMLGMIMLHYIT